MPNSASICAVLDAHAVKKIDRIPPAIRIGELRLDLLHLPSGGDEQRLHEVVRRCSNRFERLIATYHAWATDGNTRESIEKQLAIALLSGADTVDIALERGADHVNHMLHLTRSLGREHIVSLHVKQFPNEIKQLAQWVKSLAAFHPRWSKLAVSCNGKQQADAIVALYAEHSSLIAIPMGTSCANYRPKLCQHGAPFTYAHCGHPVAPGQLSVWEMLDLTAPSKAS